MATSSNQGYLSHIERTAQEPRSDSLHKVILSRIDEVSDNIRLLRLSIPKDNLGIKFLPGQWLDVHVPGIPKPGGFTITSTPNLALPESGPLSDPYLELAIQKSPANPPAAYLWRPVSSILNSTLNIRVGGSFVWPPPSLSTFEVKGLKKVVFVAGGVGINPLISILSHLREMKTKSIEVPREFIFVYSIKDLGSVEKNTKILFLERVVQNLEVLGGTFKLFLTGGDGMGAGTIEVGGRMIEPQRRRVGREDIISILGPVEDRRNTACYVCGVPSMTDEFVNLLQKADGMDERNVLFERWW